MYSVLKIESYFQFSPGKLLLKESYDYPFGKEAFWNEYELVYFVWLVL